MRAIGFAVLFLLLPALSWSPVQTGHLDDAPPPVMFGNPYSATQSAPAYAFNGAFANYSLTYFTDEGIYAYKSEFIISNVDQSAQTFSVRSVYNSYLAAFGSFDNATFEQPIPFPAASPLQLQEFKEGKVPFAYYKDNVSANVVVSVPAGTFVTYEVRAPVSTVWFDITTGLLIQENGLMLGEGSGLVGLVLASTNIKGAPQAQVTIPLLVLLASVSTVAICFTALAVTARRSRLAELKGDQQKSDENPDQPQQKSFLM